jgi:hypothetical protein
MAATNTSTAKKTTARKSTAKKSTARTTASRKTAAKKTTRKSTAARKTTARKPAPKKQPLLEREPDLLLEDAGYAYVAIVNDVVELAKGLPARVEKLRDEAVEAAEETPSLLKAAPRMVETSVTHARERLSKEAERYVARFEKAFDKKAREGRRVAEKVKKDERVARILDQTGNTRSQIKAAITSVTKTADVAVNAAADQAEVARSQTKAAVTTARKSADAVRSSTKAAATSVRKTADVAAHAAAEQAETARSQVKAAVTSTRKSAEVISEAVTQ